MEIWSSQYGVMNEVIAQSGVDPRDIAGIGITNQRETTILWEQSHRPPGVQRHRLAVPPHGRHRGRAAQDARAWTNTSGRTPAWSPDAYFSATKIKWILDHVPGRTGKG